MAITQTGSTLTFPVGVSSTPNSGTVSSTITVPADAEIAVVGWTGFGDVANYFSAGAMTFTKGGADSAMTSAVTGANGGDNSTSFFQGAMFYIVQPDTGTNKSLKYDWVGTSVAPEESLCCVTFWKGIDTASPVRSALGAQASGTPYTTGTLTALTNDLIVAFAFGYVGNTEGTIDSWSNLTELTELVHNTDADGALATGSPSGNTTVAASTDTNYQDGGIVAIVLKPGASTFTWLEMFWSSLLMPIKHRVREMVGY